MVDRGVRRGRLPAPYPAVADKGCASLLKKTLVGSDGLPNITDIDEGVDVGKGRGALQRE